MKAIVETKSSSLCPQVDSPSKKPSASVKLDLRLHIITKFISLKGIYEYSINIIVLSSLRYIQNYL